MQLWLYAYLNQNKNTSVFCYKKYTLESYIYFVIKVTILALFYKTCYLFTYNVYYKPLMKRLLNCIYKDEFHPDLDSRFLEYSWLREDHYDNYRTILIKARNRAHDLDCGW